MAAPSSIAAGQADPAPVVRVADQAIPHVRKADLETHDAPCTPPGPAPEALQAPVDVPALAHRAPASALALALEHRVQVEHQAPVA